MIDFRSYQLVRRILTAGIQDIISVIKQIVGTRFLFLKAFGSSRGVPAGGRDIIVLTAVLLSNTVSDAHAHSFSTDNDRSPNIIVIIADALGWNDIGYHNTEIQTPNLDNLAEGGGRLDQFYVYSTCSPTRVAMQPGQNPAQLNVFSPRGS